MKISASLSRFMTISLQIMIYIQSCSFCREKSAHTSFTVNENQSSDAQSVSWLVLRSILVLFGGQNSWKKLDFWGHLNLKVFKHKLLEVEVFLFKDKVCITEHEPKALVKAESVSRPWRWDSFNRLLQMAFIRHQCSHLFQSAVTKPLQQVRPNF